MARDRDSTLIHGQAIYCGSAEGVVTKYVVNPTTFEPEPVASTQALGYGAWALAIGNVTASSGDELVVGTHRGIHVIGLTPTAGFLPLLASKELPWEQFRPHHLKIADIDPSGVQEFAFATEGGDLVVCNVAGSSVNELWRHPEPGILDLECVGNYEFVLLSTRGFLIKIRKSLTPSGAEVLASSSRLFGIPVDLEARGNGQLVVLQVNVRAVPLPGTPGDSLRVFDAATLAEVPMGCPASAPAGSFAQAHWWSGSEKTRAWPNLLEGACLSSSGSPLDWLATCRHTPGGFGDDVPAADVSGNDLRDGFHLPLAQADAQSIALFEDLTHGATRVVVGTAGGRAIVLDPALRNQVSAVQSESIDFGSGGMGLAAAPAIQAPGVAQDEVNLRADVYLGTLFTHAVPTNHQVPLPNSLPADDAVAAVTWLEWTGTALAQHAVKVLDGSGPDNPKAYGVSGICAGDAIRGNGTQELVVTTMDGQLFVFARNSQGHVGALLFREWLEGSAGPFNSILVADLDSAAPGNEIYVAGSLGLRKFRQL